MRTRIKNTNTFTFCIFYVTFSWSLRCGLLCCRLCGLRIGHEVAALEFVEILFPDSNLNRAIW